MRPALRPRVAIALVVAAVLLLAWYAPHLDAILHGSRQDYGVEIGLPWVVTGVVTAPIDQILLPALLRIDWTVLVAGVVWLPLVALAVLLIARSPLLHERRTASAVSAGPIATILVLWAPGTREAPRFLGFLSVPLVMLAATGVEGSLRGTGAGRLRLVSAALALVARVFADMTRPRVLECYLGRAVTHRPFSADEICDARHVVAVVVQPWVITPTVIPCERRAGVRTYPFEQYARGGQMRVWLIPPQP